MNKMKPTLENYAMKILADAGCDCYTYGGGRRENLLSDLKAEFPSGMEHGFGYVEVANAILAISRPEPIKRRAYKVVACCVSFGADSLESAKDEANETLINWMAEEQENWKDAVPTETQKEDWDYMIYNSGYYIQKYNPMTDEYEMYYEPSEDDLRKIGWMLWDERNAA